MNCENCQELLSDFLDASISFVETSEIEAHLQECAPCFAVQQELASILDVCNTYSDDSDSPPNPQALWLRISNLIESEQQLSTAANTNKSDERIYQRLWNRLGKQTWQMSLPQVMSGVGAIAVAVALSTSVFLRGLEQNNNEAFKSSGSNIEASFANYQSNLGDRLSNQQQVINYWNQRVEQRKVQWDKRTREAFERNLRVLDEAVAQYRDALTQNPRDEVYQEALDSVLEDKVALLREFSAL